MLDYTRLQFRDHQNADKRDFEKIQRLLAKGEEELASMNYYHSVQELKHKNASNVK